ncbi:MAG: hypothetical protein HQL64_12610 [Magnetococcales bacterium]|nr:hypothetical protein [Magnetococcales bacterium]
MEKNIAQQVSESFRYYLEGEVYYGWAFVAFLLILAVVLGVYLLKLHRQQLAREAKLIEKAEERATKKRPVVKMPPPNIVLGTREARDRFKNKKI